MNRLKWMASLPLAALAVLHCGESDERRPTEDDVPDSCDVAIDRFKELEIVDDSVIEDPRTRNETNGPWSFRRLVSELVPAGANPEEFVAKWLDSWSSPRQVNGFRVQQRGNGRQSLVCPWLRATPENACDDNCTTCSARRLDLAKAPFKLIGIANRLDLTEMYDNSAGEGRFIFGATIGPSDLAASRRCANVADTACTLDMSVIIEYALPNRDGRDVHYWANTFHRLGSHAAFDDAYKADLENLTASITTRGAAPWRPNGSALSQVRSNERIFEWDWELREFAQPPEGSLTLVPTSTENTPDPSLNGSASLERWLVDNRDRVKTERYQMPPLLLGGYSPSQTFKWHVDVDEALRRPFARNTCNGCHQSEEPPVDGNFHVTPHATGIARLSRFLHDPANLEKDELSRRGRIMALAICRGPAQ